MKIAIQQLSQSLSNGLAPMYLISGDEYLLIDEACGQIRETAKEFDFLEREIIHADASFDWQNLLLQANNLSLFGDKAIIELRISKLKINDIGAAVLKTYAANPPLNKLLLIITGKLDAAVQNSLWFKSVNDSGIVLQIWPLERSQLSSWVANRLHKAGLQLSVEGAQMLIDCTEGNLLALAQEIEKLSLIYGKRKLEVSQIIEVIADDTRFNVFELSNNMLSGDPKRITKILSRLQNDGIEPAIIIWAITKELRLLLNIAANYQNINNLERAMYMYKVRFDQKVLFKNALQKYTIKDFENALLQAAKIDLVNKGAMVGNVWHELQHLCFIFCKKCNT